MSISQVVDREAVARLNSILAKLDITLSELRDFLRGVDDRTLSDLYDRLSDIAAGPGITGEVRIVDSDIKVPVDLQASAIAYDPTQDVFLVGGSQLRRLLQRPGTFELLVQLRHAGVDVDPRAIRALTSSDFVSAILNSKARLSPVTTHSAERIDDLVEHPSGGQAVGIYQEKLVLIYVTVGLGTPTSVDVWVEVADEDVAAKYVQCGGKKTFTAAGEDLIAWTVHSEYARVNAQGVGCDASNYFDVTTIMMAKV
ncbi:MAG: hypothetical protein ACE5Z5_05765 [Candidatus Bathyarchaeia archaeon]